MDIRDITDEDRDFTLKQVQHATIRAKRRQGEAVQDHPSPEQLIGNFMMNLTSNLPSVQIGHRNGRMILATNPTPYAPCHRLLHELKPMKIAQLRLETHHRGGMVVVRVRTPPKRMALAVVAIVEDEEGTATTLQLFHQPEELDVPAKEILQPDMVLALKEPFLKYCTEGSYALRVDHVSDVTWLEGAEEHVPIQWRRSLILEDSTRIRLQGNDAVQSQKWAEAERLYTRAIRAAASPEEERPAYLNRSLANLRLGRFEKAFSDAVHSREAGMASEKGLFREARALYEHRRFERCIEILRQLVESNPENKDAKREIERVKARLREQQTGEYNFCQIYKQAEQTPPIVDCATYSAVVEIRTSPGRGRGLFTTKPVSAGQLLLCEKAFAYFYAAGDYPTTQMPILLNGSTGRAIGGAQAHMITRVVQKTYHNPGTLKMFEDLHRGDYTTTVTNALAASSSPIVDSFLVDKISSLNGFGAPRTTLASEATVLHGEPPEADTSSGVWLLASHINHSCLANCKRSFIGDMIIFRAMRDMQAGTELFISYCFPEPLDSYAEVQEQLRHWGFTCDCKLCRNRRITRTRVLGLRRKLVDDLVKTVMPNSTTRDKSMQLLSRLEKIYPKIHGIPRSGLFAPYLGAGSYLFCAGKKTDGVEMLVRGLEALDFKITANLRGGHGNPPSLEILQWGDVISIVPLAFIGMSKAYETSAPELCATVKNYAKIAYAIVVGENETVLDVFPSLA
ncbi:hypothetical protein EsDP_00006273 [Epichloe bromicola]|uniref:SET domain-containing protein n=1 Tax=Epichloe bromicola TaxID=79588 RepID=A0ABQ0CX54_9HYPO